MMKTLNPQPSMKYYIIAGEASGDLHAANLMAALKVLDAGATFRYWGGDRMQAQGGVMVKHIRELAFMGFVEVLMNIRAIFKNLSLCKKDVADWAPDVLILVDYPGFNLRMARFAKEKGIRVVYYISPQIWAWKQSRVRQIKRDVDSMLVILPFEKDFYKKHGVEVSFVGHPLLDAIAQVQRDDNSKNFKEKHGLPTQKKLVAILPGSRKQEIERMLSVMTSVAGNFPDSQFVVAGMSGHTESLYQGHLNHENISIVYDQTYPLLHHADAAMVTSGTATLETALFGVPQVVCYKTNKPSYLIAKRLVKVAYISLVNLIMNKPVVKELIQDGFNREALIHELSSILHDDACRKRITDDYKELYHKLGGPGASRRAATIISNLLENISA